MCPENKNKIEELLRVMEYTQMNYDSMWKRLTRKAHFASFILVYYSIFLIIYSLTQIVFSQYYHEALSSYFNIILSIVVLVYSLINSNARYDARITSIKEAIDAVKNEKRSLSLNTDSFDNIKNAYDKIIEKTEHRDDIDFFDTVKLLCKKHNICWLRKKVKHSANKKVSEEEKDKEMKEQARIIGYLNQMNPIFLQCRNICSYLGHAFLILIPIVIFLVCILAKVNLWLP